MPTAIASRFLVIFFWTWLADKAPTWVSVPNNLPSSVEFLHLNPFSLTLPYLRILRNLAMDLSWSRAAYICERGFGAGELVNWLTGYPLARSLTLPHLWNFLTLTLPQHQKGFWTVQQCIYPCAELNVLHEWGFGTRIWCSPVGLRLIRSPPGSPFFTTLVSIPNLPRSV